MEGKSLLPVFNKNEPVQREAICWEHEGNRAIRQDKWKLVAKGKKGKGELYDVETDRSELYDLAGEQPLRVKGMADMWRVYAKRTGVIPLPD